MAMTIEKLQKDNKSLKEEIGELVMGKRQSKVPKQKKAK
jgi:hypothetical protein